MRVLVATIVHRPEDARIRHRQIPALLDAGCEVVYVAPAGDTSAGHERLERITVPAAAGRNRLRAIRAVRPVLREASRRVDLAVLHDPELLLVTGAIDAPVIWDVHEDLAGQITDKAWVPGPLHGVATIGARLLERRGRRLPRTIAEAGYRDRHPDAVLVPNSVRVPDTVVPTGADRLVYLGRVSRGRGADVLGDVAQRLPDGLTLDVIGPADPDLTLDGSALRARGFVPNDVALAELGGAMAGLSLLQDLPNYRHSLPTKLLEYLAHGVPVISTPLPAAVELVERHDCGIIVDFDDPAAVVDAAVALRDDADRRARLAANGRAAVAAHHNWAVDAARMLDFYRELAAS